MSVNRARRRRGSADAEKGLPLEVNNQAVLVTGKVEQPDAGAAVEVAEPDIEPVLAGGEVPPVSETEAPPLTAGSAVPDVPEASPSSDGSAAVTAQRADGSPESVPGSAGARTDARLAHVHLAVGMFGLARAELETLAGRGLSMSQRSRISRRCAGGRETWWAPAKPRMHTWRRAARN